MLKCLVDLCACSLEAAGIFLSFYLSDLHIPAAMMFIEGTVRF